MLFAKNRKSIVFGVLIIALSLSACGDAGWVEKEDSEATPTPVNQASLTMLANISGCPAITLPCGVAPSGLPLALQLIARPFDEAELLGAAQILEKTWGWLFPPDQT